MRMLDYFPIILIAFHWLRILELYLKICDAGNQVFRRWFTKRHITNEMREMYGAYEKLFLYYANCDHEEFYNMTRMTVPQFRNLHEILAPRLLKTSLRQPLSTELRLALALNYLAHGDSQRTTSDFFRVGSSTTYSIIAEVCPLIWELLSPTYLKWKTPQQWKVVAQGFRVRWGFPNCIGALDGKEIWIKVPPNSGSLYYNYKKFNSFKLLAICDAYYRFTWVDIGAYGSISDVSAFQATDLYQALESSQADLPDENGILPRSNIRLPFFFIGDAIFTLASYLMKPFARVVGLSDRQRNFNYRLSRARNCIEDSFGILTTRWQILHTRLNYKLETSINIVKALVCLHNFIITDELPKEAKDRRYGIPVRREEPQEELMNDDYYNVPANVIRHREILTDYFNSPEGELR